MFKKHRQSLIWGICVVVIAILGLPVSAIQTKPAATASKQKTFATAQEAAEAIVKATESYDVDALTEIVGPAGKDLVVSDEPARDKERATAFAAQARTKMKVQTDPRNPNRATMIIGNEDWPFPVPLVKKTGRWSLDVAAGRKEVLYRRIGGNELDMIQVAHGYVEAQHAYALQKHDGSAVNQYAQRIIATEGKQDGLAWKNSDGTWGGPVGEKIAAAIQNGYARNEPYHGYYFRILTGQGPAAPLGQMNFVVNGAMIGGFALLAFPSQYRVSGVKTFMVSHDGVVYEKDLGEKTTDIAKTITLFNPDRTWIPVQEHP